MVLKDLCMSEPRPAPSKFWLDALDREYRSSLVAFFRRRTGSQSDAEDMVQEVFARILATPEIDAARAGAYIFRAATNLLRDRARREGVRGAYREDLVAAASDALDEQDPERLLVGRLALNATKAVLDALPHRTRVIFVLYRLHGMAQRDIAGRMGISVSAVEKHIATAMKALMHFRAEWQ